MKKKGFTLIELLAVIVILAVIALIAMPNIVRVMSNSREDSYGIQINNIKAAMKNYVSQNTFSFPNSGSIYLTLYQLANDHLIDYKISNPKTGNNISLDTILEIRNTGNNLEYIVNIDDNDVSYNNQILDNLPNLKLYSDYGVSSDNLKDLIETASYNNTNLKNNVTINKIDDTKYKFTLSQNNISVSVIYNVTYYVGKTVYFNPTTGSTCNDYIEDNSLDDVKTGCMKWYIYNMQDNLVNMILDHNTTSLVEWNSLGNNSYMDEVLDALKDDTATWTNYVKDTARLITADEIAKITGADKALEWSSNKNYSDNPMVGLTISYFYFDGEETNNPVWQVGINEESKYEWLYDNTYVIDSSYQSTGYWTSTPINNGDGAWLVTDGALEKTVVNSKEYGLRPVITISKDIVL